MSEIIATMPKHLPSEPAQALAKPRLTRAALFWIVVYLGGPVLLAGVLLDALLQWTTGRCTGLWCFF